MKFATHCAEQWYDYKAQGVVETDEVKMLQDFNIQTYHIINHQWPDIIIIISIYNTTE